MQALRAAAVSRRIASATSPWKTQLRSEHKFGAREMELLAEDPALSPFKSTKSTAKKMQMVGDAVIVVLGLGFLYETYYRWDKKWEESKK